jgi:hypothetical protein
MPAITMTKDLAFAAGKDAANRQMRATGRAAWNVNDFNLAVRTESDLYPLCREFPDIPPDHCGCRTCRAETATTAAVIQ